MKYILFNYITYLKMIFFIGIFLSNSEILFAIESRMSSEVQSLPSSDEWNVEMYGEVYKSITRQIPIQFSRILIGKKQVWTQEDSIKLGLENYQTGSIERYPPQSKWTLTLGYYYSLFESLQTVLMLRSENFIKTQKHEKIVRAGFYGGKFKFLLDYKNIYVDSYYDLFLQNSFDKGKEVESSQSFLSMGSLSGRLGWRWNTPISSLFVDPLMLEFRGYANSNHTLAGDSYAILNLGPRILYYPSHTKIYASLFMSRSYNLEKSSSYSVAPTWVLFSFGGDF